MSHDNDYDRDYDNNRAHFSLSTSTPAVPATPDAKRLPVNTTGPAVGSGETDRSNRTKASDGGYVLNTERRAINRGAEMLLNQALDEASADNASGGGQKNTVFQRILRRDSTAAEGEIEELSATVVKEEERAATPTTADERCEQDEEHGVVAGLSVPRGGSGDEEGQSTAEKETLWQQRQALLRKYQEAVGTRVQ